MVPLRRLHADRIYLVRRYKIPLEYWRNQPTERIIESLKPRIKDPGYQEFLKVSHDGVVFQGNTRIKVLQERGYNVDLLPRYPTTA